MTNKPLNPGDALVGLLALTGCALPALILIIGTALIPLGIAVLIFRAAFGH